MSPAHTVPTQLYNVITFTQYACMIVLIIRMDKLHAGGHSDTVILSPNSLLVFCRTVGDLTVSDLIPVTPVV